MGKVTCLKLHIEIWLLKKVLLGLNKLAGADNENKFYLNKNLHESEIIDYYD